MSEISVRIGRVGWEGSCMTCNRVREPAASAEPVFVVQGMDRTCTSVMRFCPLCADELREQFNRLAGDA